MSLQRELVVVDRRRDGPPGVGQAQAQTAATREQVDRKPGTFRHPFGAPLLEGLLGARVRVCRQLEQVAALELHRVDRHIASRPPNRDPRGTSTTVDLVVLNFLMPLPGTGPLGRPDALTMKRG